MAVSYPMDMFIDIVNSAGDQKAKMRTEVNTRISPIAASIVTTAGTWSNSIMTITAPLDCMMQCLQSTGTTCRAYSHDSVAQTCAFSSSRTPDTERSLTSTLYSINSHTFAISGVAKTAGKCYWKSDSEVDYDNDWWV